MTNRDSDKVSISEHIAALASESNKFADALAEWERRRAAEANLEWSGYECEWCGDELVWGTIPAGRALTCPDDECGGQSKYVTIPQRQLPASK